MIAENKIAPTTPADFPREVTIELAKCVKFALNNLKGSGGILWNEKSGDFGGTWEDWFMDALDGIGYRIDREKFWEREKPKAKKRKVPK